MSATEPTKPIRLVLPIGFAGPREILAPKPGYSAAQMAAAEVKIKDHLVKVLKALRDQFDQYHFLTTASQIAIGADTLFTRACQEAGISQRILLPLPREKYFKDGGSKGPDFAPHERQAAEELLKSPHIIEERVICASHERRSRFQEINLEILAISEIIICLTCAPSGSKAGGTYEVLHGAIKRRKPTLEIQVSWESGTAEIAEHWCIEIPPTQTSNAGWKNVIRHLWASFCDMWPWKRHSPSPPEKWAPPRLPHELTKISVLEQTEPSPGIPLQSRELFLALKDTGSQLADRHKALFKWAALIIITTHILATTFATMVLIAHELKTVPWLLSSELVLLSLGLFTHYRLHHGHAARVWALSRLIAEVARSVRGMQEHHIYLRYLFSLPFPQTLRPLLRTINVLHLASTKHSTTSWQDKRDHYLTHRLGGRDGQVRYYRNQLETAERWHMLASVVFYLATAAALVCTCLKLLHKLPDQAPLLGLAAVIFPMIAVAALSLVASFDVAARVHTYTELSDSLAEARNLIATATSEAEFTRLALETETRLLGETANWCARRSFTSVA